MRRIKEWFKKGKKQWLILSAAAAFLLLCLAYWYAEFDPKDPQTGFADILLWNLGTLFGQDFADHYPVTLAGRLLGILLLLFSVFGVSALTGMISSMLVEYRMNAIRGLKKMQKLKNHIVICGWKADQRLLLQDIIRKNSHLNQSDLVLINQEDESKNQNLLSDPALRGIHFVQGDYSDESVLEVANIREASKVLILGEAKEGTEAELEDSKVLVTTLLIRSLNPRIHICAEVHTLKYKKYLEYQKCDEVIYTEEYTRFVLSTATSYMGMAKVLSALLDNGDGICIQVEHLDESWVGRTFGELSEYYKENGHILLIGLLANMGSEKELKYHALAKAQKTPNISQLVSNLKEVKELEKNQPIMNPMDDFRIEENMGAIILAAEV